MSRNKKVDLVGKCESIWTAEGQHIQLFVQQTENIVKIQNPYDS